MKQGLREVLRGTAEVGFAALALVLAGCNFFVPQTNSTGGGSGGSSTGDFAYVSNSTSGSTSIAGYVLSAGTLAPMSTATFNLQFVPSAMVVSANNLFLYVASQTGGIYLYSIGTGGVLTIANSGSPLVSGNFVGAMDISPDGNYLFTVDVTGSTLTVFTVTPSSGFFSASPSVPIPAPAVGTNACSVVLPCMVKVAPSEQYVAVALGTAGDQIYPFSAGTLSPPIPIPVASGVGDYAVTIDASNNVYFARTNVIAAYTLNGGTATEVTTKPPAGAAGTRGIVVSSDGKFLYEGDYNATGTIFQYSLATGGVVTPLSPATIAAPTNVFPLGVDNSGKYVLALGYNTSSGLSLYTIGATGTLSSATASVATGALTNPPIPALMALTH
jgi:6-phosphogluconolactonase